LCMRRLDWMTIHNYLVLVKKRSNDAFDITDDKIAREQKYILTMINCKEYEDLHSGRQEF